MFRSATIQLTGLYLLLLMSISLFFSTNLYRLSVRELGSGLSRQQGFIEGLPRSHGVFDIAELIASREAQLNEGKRHIVAGLVNINLFILVLGGIGSYFLARRTLRPIQEAHNAQVRFTADASHELRTPMASMRAEIEVALRDPSLTKTQAVSLLHSNLEELAKLERLSDGLLKLAREETDLPREQFDSKDAIDEAVASLESLALSKEIAIIVTATPIPVYSNRTAVVQVLRILIDNAIKYSPPRTTVTIDSFINNDSLTITVADQGAGIATKDLEQIFERFYRVDSSRSSQHVDGHGLGLAIAKKVVATLGGIIIAESTPKKGSCFSFTLPRKS